MPDINISVQNKIAVQTNKTEYICDNSDFIIKFNFDAEWDAYDTKTARFCYNSKYVDAVFTGDSCAVPIISDTNDINIGVYAGNLHTTTPALVLCEKSILGGSGFPADPPDDVYNQIMELIQGLGTPDAEAIAKAVADYLIEHPLEETDPSVPTWAKAEKKPTYTAEEVGAIANTELQTAINSALAQGPAGATGPAGADGKSAYAYAVDGGYTGTEEEFAAKLAQEKFVNPNALTFTGAVTGSYDGSAPVNVEIPSGGGSGSDISLGLTGATVGQIAKITSVDDTGKPTAWDAVDMPSGGDNETNFQLVFNQECLLDANVSAYEVDIDFGLQDFKEFVALIEYSASTNDVYQDTMIFDGVVIESYGGPTNKGNALNRVIYAKRITQTEYMGIHRAHSLGIDWPSGNLPSTLSYFSNRINRPTGKLEILRTNSAEATTITIKLYKR